MKIFIRLYINNMNNIKKIFLSLSIFFIIENIATAQNNAGELISFGCNSKQKTYLVFPSDIQIVNISPADIHIEEVAPNVVSFILNDPFVNLDKSVNGIILLTNGVHYPIEIKKQDDIPADETTIVIGNVRSSDSNVLNDKQRISAEKLIEEEKYKINAKETFELKNNYVNVKGSTNRINSELNAIAVDDNYVYIKITTKNRSSINYQIDFQGLVVRSSNNLRVAGSTEEYIEPVYIYGEKAIISAKETVSIVLVYTLFTIKDTQNLIYLLKELNGGRSVEFEIRANLLLKSAYNLDKTKK